MNLDLFCEKLFARATEAGFAAAEVYFAAGSKFRVNAFEGELDDYQVNASQGLSFRGLLNGQMGYASTEVLDDAAIDFLVEQAKQNASVLESKDEQFIFPGSESYPEVNSFHEELAGVETREKIERVLEIEKRTLALRPEVTKMDMCLLGTGEGRVEIRNTYGLKLQHRDNAAFAYASAVAKRGDEVRDGMAVRFATRFEDLDAGKIAEECVAEACSYLGARQIDSGKMPMVLRNDMVVDMLETFVGCFSADQAQKGLSLLKGREGEAIAASCVTLVDDPLLAGGFSSAPFDAEGVATYTKNIVESGVLQTLFHNLKTAKKAGVTSTGNAFKAAYSSPVSVAPSNFYLQKGGMTREELFAKMGSGLFVCSLQGLHSGANSVTGDFSLGAKGFWIEGGKIAYPVEQITIAGNFFELLTRVTDIADDLWFGAGGVSIGGPSVLVSEISVAGK